MKIYDIEMIREFYKNYSSKIERIREKIKTDIIITIKGIGYRIDSEVY